MAAIPTRKNNNGGECPLCGEEYSSNLPNHLQRGKCKVAKRDRTRRRGGRR